VSTNATGRADTAEEASPHFLGWVLDLLDVVAEDGLDDGLTDERRLGDLAALRDPLEALLLFGLDVGVERLLRPECYQ
jgi:hypothetical protein